MIVFGDGTQTRDFTFVGDTAAGIVLAGEDARAIGQTINLGSGREITVNELAREVAAAAGRPDAAVEHDRPRPGDVLRLYADMSHARELLGYAPKMTMAEGLAALLAWYRARPETPEELLEQEIVHNWAVSRT
jgi:UDP-glucose 4-epimerase